MFSFGEFEDLKSPSKNGTKSLKIPNFRSKYTLPTVSRYKKNKQITNKQRSQVKLNHVKMCNLLLEMSRLVLVGGIIKFEILRDKDSDSD
jgi:hypothetical protein